MADVIYLFKIVIIALLFYKYIHIYNERDSNSVLYGLFSGLVATAALVIYYFSPEDIIKSIGNINSLTDFFINPTVGLIFFILTYCFWNFIAWIQGKELIFDPDSTGGYDGGFGGGRRIGYYRRHGIRVEDLKLSTLFFMFIFSSALAGIIVFVNWLAGYSSNPLDYIGLALNIFSIFLSVPFFIFYFVDRKKH